MEKLRFTARISAPVHHVWTSMLDDAPYREWTRAFGDSYYEGGWENGQRIRFLGRSDDGTVNGLFGRVVESRPDEYVCVEYDGQVLAGVDDTTSAAARLFAGARESYAFSESGGVTTVEVELDIDDSMADMLTDAWPRALDRLKEIAER